MVEDHKFKNAQRVENELMPKKLTPNQKQEAHGPYKVKNDNKFSFRAIDIQIKPDQKVN